tara:strand:+ start:218 stop:601 length:384 start_codon:yes stop_codon:yes gene_type:complete
MSEEFKRGDRVLVWDDIEDTKSERIFLRKIEGASCGIVCVRKKDEDFFEDGGIGFDIICYKNCEAIEPMKTKAIEYVQMFMDLTLTQSKAKECAILMTKELLNYAKKHGYIALQEELEQTKIDIWNL